MWNHTAEIKHIWKDKNATSHEDVLAIGNQLADALAADVAFRYFDASMFRKIPSGDEYFRPVDYFDRMLDKLYDYCDVYRIWLK